MPTFIDSAVLTSRGPTHAAQVDPAGAGVTAGDTVAFALQEDGQVIVSRADGHHRDPVIAAFLSLLAGDIEAGRAIGAVPPDLVRVMIAYADKPLEDEEIEGDVAL